MLEPDPGRDAVPPSTEPPTAPAMPRQVVDSIASTAAGTADASGRTAARPGRREGFPASPEARAFRRRFFPHASIRDWNDWRWQARSRIRTLAELERVFRLSHDERAAIRRHTGSLPVGITPYYASLMGLDDPEEPLRRTHIPVGAEYLRSPGEADDPLGEDARCRCPGPRAPLSRPRAVPHHRLLLDLLPLLHPLAHGRRDRAASTISASASGRRRSPTSRPTPRSATCCSRAATR